MEYFLRYANFHYSEFSSVEVFFFALLAYTDSTMDSIVSSATKTYGATYMFYQGLEDINLVPDILAHSSISADRASASRSASSTEYLCQYQNSVHPKGLIYEYSMNSSTGQPSTFSMVSQSEPNSSILPSGSRDSLQFESRPAVATTRVLLRQ